tara:strand:- start:981 stop:1487 length:507 start_codon:yes stop_codon:yes gene_type:complete
MKIYEDFLPEHNFEEIQKLLMSANFPFYRQEHVGTKEDKSLGCLLTHMLFVNYEKVSDPKLHHIIMQPIIDKLNIEEGMVKIIRTKVNLYPYQNEPFKSAFHIDQSAKHKVLLLSINTNNGYTEFHDGTIFNAVENNAIIFDGDTPHRSVSQTDYSAKINININYEVV